MKALIIIATVLVLFSCKKEKINPILVEPQVQFNSPKTVGSYWVYQWYKVEKNGDETLLPQRDSIYVFGDTTINNLNYTVYKGTWFVNSNYTSFQRDSSGYIFDNYGHILYSYTNFNDTLKKGSQDTTWNWYMKMFKDVQVSVPAGSFTSIEARATYYKLSGEPVTNCGDLYFTLGSWYVDGVGKVKATTGFIYELKNCDYIREARLVDYYIAP